MAAPSIKQLHLRGSEPEPTNRSLHDRGTVSNREGGGCSQARRVGGRCSTATSQGVNTT